MFNDKDLQLIESKSINVEEYRNKAELLKKHLTTIPNGNIIKLAKEIEPIIFIKILKEIIDSRFLYDIIKAIEDIEYYNVNGILVLTLLILKIKGEDYG